MGLVAIVLGAGFLLKVIPPETDVGINDRHLINIDGSLVTNPLDINEILPLTLNPTLNSAFPLYRTNDQSIPQNNDGRTNLSPLNENNPFLQALPPTPGIQSSEPPVSSTEPKDNRQPGKTDPIGSDHPLMPAKPSDELITPVVDNRGSNTSVGPGTGSSSPGSPNTPSTPDPTIPDPSDSDPTPPGPTTPDPKNPDPTEPGPIIEVPKTPPSAPDITIPGNDETSEPLQVIPPISSDIPSSPDYPTQSVPDQGATIAMMGAAVAGLLALNRRTLRRD